MVLCSCSSSGYKSSSFLSDKNPIYVWVKVYPAHSQMKPSTLNQSNPHNTVTRDSFHRHVLYFFSNAVCKKWNSWLGSNRGTKAQALHREAPAITGEPIGVWSDCCRGKKKSVPFVLFTTNAAISPLRESNFLPIFQLLKSS